MFNVVPHVGYLLPFIRGLELFLRAYLIHGYYMYLSKNVTQAWLYTLAVDICMLLLYIGSHGSFTPLYITPFVITFFSTSHLYMSMPLDICRIVFVASHMLGSLGGGYMGTPTVTP